MTHHEIAEAKESIQAVINDIGAIIRRHESLPRVIPVALVMAESALKPCIELLELKAAEVPRENLG